MSTRDRWLMAICFLAIHIIWGSTYLAIHYAVESRIFAAAAAIPISILLIKVGSRASEAESEPEYRATIVRDSRLMPKVSACRGRTADE